MENNTNKECCLRCFSINLFKPRCLDISCKCHQWEFDVPTPSPDGEGWIERWNNLGSLTGYPDYRLVDKSFITSLIKEKENKARQEGVEHVIDFIIGQASALTDISKLRRALMAARSTSERVQ